MMIMTTIVSCIWPFLVNSMEHRTHFSCTAIHFLMWYNEREREWANVRLTLRPHTTCHMILYGHGWCSVRRIKGPYEKRKKSIERWINENGTERNGRAETQVLECARTPLVSAHFSFAACNSNGNFHLSGYHAFCPHFYSCCLSFTLSLSKKLHPIPLQSPVTQFIRHLKLLQNPLQDMSHSISFFFCCFSWYSEMIDALWKELEFNSGKMLWFWLWQQQQ